MLLVIEITAMIRRVVLFVVVFSVLQLAWQASTESSAARIFVEKTIVAPAAFAINLATPAAKAYASGSHLRSPGGGINIINGCDGMELLFLLSAGFMVAPLAWRSRILGVLAGIPLIYILNQIRILALFYSNRSDPNLFDSLHGFVAPLGMVLLIAAYFYVWVFRAQRVDAAPIDSPLP
jgi:exosortase family protein XrtM